MTTIQRTETGLLVPPDLLGTLGELIPAPKSIISPLRFSPPKVLDQKLRRALVTAKVLNSDGTLVADARRTLEALAEVTGFARVQFSSGPTVSEMVFYFAPGAQVPVSVTNTSDGLLIQDPGEPAAFTEVMENLSGVSQFRSFDFSASLPIAEGLVLAAMVDRMRKDILRDIARGEPVEVGDCTPEIIARELSQPLTNTTWLATAVAQMAGVATGLEASDVGTALQSLVAKELVLAQDGRYILSVIPALLARRFLLFDQAFRLEAGRQALADGTPVVVGFTCLQAGVHDLLCLEYTQDHISLNTVSSSTLLRRLEFFISRPDALDKAATETAQTYANRASPSIPEPQSDKAVVSLSCAKCGNPIKPGIMFCGSCGEPVQAIPLAAPPTATTVPVCVHCGNPISSNAKFCRNCGKSV